jgi:tellurite resistance protein
MTVRKILSARAARPQVASMLKGLVRAAVYMGRSDGTLDETEIDSFIDSIRELVVAAVGEAHVRELANTSLLLDEARAARVELRTKGEAAYLTELGSTFAGGFKRDALVVCWRVIAADGVVQPEEVEAFRRLAVAMGFTGDETTALESMARGTAAGAARGKDSAAIETMTELLEQGWKDPYRDLRAKGLEVSWHDASAEYDSAIARLRVDLDAVERVLHLHVTDVHGPGPHVICLYGSQLHAVLALFDAAKSTLTPASVPQLLVDLVPLSDGLFIERDGRLVQVHPE